MTGSTLRLIWSAVVAFGFYFGWSFWANSGPDISSSVTLRSAIVQGTYSGVITLGFTFVLEKLVHRFRGNCLSLAFMTPILCKVHSKTSQNIAIQAAFRDGLNLSARYFSGAKIHGALLAPLLPLAVQSALVISVNVLNQTPNLWLTVAPSIFFTGLYAFTYTFALLRLDQAD